MKIKEARQTYQAQIQAYQTQKNAIYKKQEALKKQMAETASNPPIALDRKVIRLANSVSLSLNSEKNMAILKRFAIYAFTLLPAEISIYVEIRA